MARKKPKVIHGLWEKIKKEYASFQEAYPDAYEQTFEGFKFGTLAELAAIRLRLMNRWKIK